MGRISKYGIPTRTITLSLPEDVVIALKKSGNASGALADVLMDGGNIDTVMEIDLSRIDEYRLKYIKARLSPIIKKAILEIVEEAMEMSLDDIVSAQSEEQEE